MKLLPKSQLRRNIDPHTIKPHAQISLLPLLRLQPNLRNHQRHEIPNNAFPVPDSLFTEPRTEKLAIARVLRIVWVAEEAVVLSRVGWHVLLQLWLVGVDVFPCSLVDIGELVRTYSDDLWACQRRFSQLGLGLWF